MKYAIALSLVVLLGAPSARAVAQAGSPAVAIEITAEVEVKVKTADGREEVKRAPAAKVTPGTTVIYTLNAKNTGKDPAADVVMTDPIPDQMEYVDGSESAEHARVTFSVDGGKSFAAKEALKVKGEDGQMRAALPSDFTHIRWQLEKPLAPGEARAVSFRAKVE
jgi:uncharacterized repeat protein (TIGR01451 family)